MNLIFCAIFCGSFKGTQHNRVILLDLFQTNWLILLITANETLKDNTDIAVISAGAYYVINYMIFIQTFQFQITICIDNFISYVWQILYQKPT